MLVGNTAAGWFWHSAGSQAPFLIGAGLSGVAMLWIAIRQRRFHI
ncbi:hypothetical protein O4J55_26625 [Paracoccus sp. PXZ]